MSKSTKIDAGDAVWLMGSILCYKPHACLCIELPHLTRRLLVTLATRTNIKADSFSLCVPRLGKSLTGCEKGLSVYDRAASPQGRRQVNGHCLQGRAAIANS